MIYLSVPLSNLREFTIEDYDKFWSLFYKLWEMVIGFQESSGKGSLAKALLAQPRHLKYLVRYLDVAIFQHQKG